MPFIVVWNSCVLTLIPHPHSWDFWGRHLKVCFSVVRDTSVLSIVAVTTLAITRWVFQRQRIIMAGKARGYGLTAELQRKVRV